MTKKLNITVTGATGTQGGAVVRALIARGHPVRAVTRDPGSAAAKTLAGLGAEVIAGDLADRAAMDRAVAGVDAVFAMATPFEKGMAAETLQGTTIADAAKSAGTFLLYSSVANADRQTGVPHFDSKYEVEKHIRAINADATILAPVAFMENVRLVRDQLRENIYPSALPPARKLAQIAVADIAASAVSVFENRAAYAGKRFDLAGDEVSGDEVVSILSRVTGRPIRYFQMPMEMVKQTMGDDAAAMFAWFDRTGYSFERRELTRAFPEVRFTSFEAWAQSFDWKSFFAR
jgi:uncharacterized protein YbjT (DUF2867 family)